VLRRHFVLATSAALACRAAALTRTERVRRAIAGRDLDRPPFTFWHHFGLTTPEDHATATLKFHRDYRTDIVKVMSDFPYPKPAGNWWEVKPHENPFAPQIRALDLIREGLRSDAPLIETIFNSWNVAEKLSSKEEVLRLKREKPQALLDALEIITVSQIHHIKRALKAGAAGIFLSVANANAASLTRDDYVRFSMPFDRRILEAASPAWLNFLHAHVDAGYLDLFRTFPAAVFNYSMHVSKIPISEVRKTFTSTIAGGIDEVNYRTLTVTQLEAQWRSAQAAAGRKFILTPGCSVPNESTREELLRLPALVRA
jgi:uroporphyrinogen-III decarboxylase